MIFCVWFQTFTWTEQVCPLGHLSLYLHPPWINGCCHLCMKRCHLNFNRAKYKHKIALTILVHIWVCKINLLHLLLFAHFNRITCTTDTLMVNISSILPEEHYVFCACCSSFMFLWSQVFGKLEQVCSTLLEKGCTLSLHSKKALVQIPASTKFGHSAKMCLLGPLVVDVCVFYPTMYRILIQGGSLPLACSG